MAERSQKRRSTRQAITRSAYVEPDTDEDFDVVESGNSDDHRADKRRKIVSSTRSRKRSEDDSPLYDEPVAIESRTKTRTKANRRSKRQRTAGASGDSTIRRVTAGIGRTRKQATVKPNSVAPVIPSDGKIPSWQTLPYEILLQIFKYAYTADSHTWLLRTARVCRAFAEPALAAFYQSPTLPSPIHLENFYALIQIPTEKTFTNYRVKVRNLELSIRSFVDRKIPNAYDLGDLVAALPHLQAIRVTSPQDEPPYRRHTLPRWRYPPTLFDSLDTNERHLKTWRMNWLFIRDVRNLQSNEMAVFANELNLRPSFQTLERLELLDFPTYTTDIEARHTEIAEAINLLPNLKSLELVSCNMIDTSFVDVLTRRLTRLRIANSPSLTSEILHSYLAKDGFCDLRELVLDHNALLDLAFLPTMKSTCPHLQVFKMDLHYYSQHHTINDADAKYEYLLGADEHPTWPATLREVELVHLQKWSSEGAQNLFQSLISSAYSLPDLRRLILHAHINISWRDRVAFREQWIDRLTRVFLDKSQPDPHLASLKVWRLWNSPKTIPEPDPVSKLFSHIDVKPRVTGAEQTSTKASDSESTSTRRSKRIGKQVADIASLRNSGAVDDAVSISDQSDVNNNEDTFIHGLCDIVDIKIDNQRPREEQFNESHFLDSEGSGDEDWNEDGDDAAEEGYAW